VNNISRMLAGLVLPIALLCAWCAWGDPSSPVAPAPQAWLPQAATMLATGDLQLAVLATLKTVVLSTAVAGVIGTLIGAVLGARLALSEAVTPTLEFLRSIPPPTIVPAAMLLIGTGAGLEVSVVTLATLWPVLLNVLQATRLIHPTLTGTGRTLRLSARSTLINIYAPCVLPGIIAGLRVAVPLAIIVALLVEMLATRPGIGGTLLSAQRDFDAPTVFALLLIVGIIGVCLNSALEWLERYVSRRLPNSVR
jgi:ABC-type nitrate/sulfonate/bicarbonate transport system permease component